MYLTLVSIASTLDSLTVKDSGQVVAGDYSHLSIRHRKYADSGLGSPILNTAQASAEWNKLFSSTGVKLPVTLTDGVHQLNYLLGVSQSGASIDATGTITGIVLRTGVEYVSLSTDPYTLYPAGELKSLANVTLITWTRDPNYFLSVYSFEKKLAADLRVQGQKSCEAVKSLLPRYLDLQSAVVRFHCKDYAGADYLVGSLSSPSSNCGC